MSPSVEIYVAFVGAFSRSRFSASVDGRVRDPQPHLILLALSSCRQPRKGQAFSDRQMDHAVESLKGMTLHLALVQPEGRLVDVAAKVLRADLVVDAYHATLEDRPDAFDAVHMDVPAHVLASGVIDGIVQEEQTAQALVCAGIVGVDRRAGDRKVFSKMLCVRNY